MTKYLIIIIMAFFPILGVVFNLYQSEKKNRQRIENNYQSLEEGITFYKTKDSLSAASVQALILTKKELENKVENYEQEISSLNLSVKRLQSISKTATVTSYIIKTEVRDSIIYVDNIISDTLNCIDYKSKYLLVKGCISDRFFVGNIKTYDTLYQFVHRVPRKFLFIKHGTKAIRQEVMTKNPHSDITYTEYIELRRRKRK
jgi:hypothetical protein